MLELSTKTLVDMLASTDYSFQQPEFRPVDAEDTVHQLCSTLHNSEADYAAIVDPESGNLVGILGYLDVVHLLSQAAREFPSLFSETVEQAGIGRFRDIVTATLTTPLHEVLAALDTHNIAGIPIVDAAGRVINFYHKTDVTFIMKASEPDEVLVNLANLNISDLLTMRDQLEQAGDIIVSAHSLTTCTPQDRLSAVLTTLMAGRSTKTVCVHPTTGACLGIVSIKDLIGYYYSGR